MTTNAKSAGDGGEVKRDEGRRNDDGSLNLGSYWFVLEPTGQEAIDVILSRIAGAGKAYHSTECWDGD